MKQNKLFIVGTLENVILLQALVVDVQILINTKLQQSADSRVQNCF